MPVLDWIGKDKVVNHHNEVPYRVLEPQYTYGEPDSGNMIIHGDNLSALKSLLPQYEGRIKCIFIDPPYNTGNEGWVYNDNVNDPRIKAWLGETVGKESEDLSRHDKWLCMMYPRLKLLHRLLSDDGAIFISIDDWELYTLKLICDEIFGSSNFILQMPRVTKKSGKSTDVFAKNHDYVLIYSKTSKVTLNAFEHNDDGFKYKDEYFESRGFYKLNQTLDYDSLKYSAGLDYPLEIEGKTYYPGTSYEAYLQRQSGNYKRADWAWRWSMKKFRFGYDNGFIVVKKSRNGTRIYTKTYQNASIDDINGDYYIKYNKRTAPISSLVLSENEYSNDNATKDLTAIFSSKEFDYSKPESLVRFVCKLAAGNKSIILDSFAGSGTTAHAVLNMNKLDGGNRKFILIEMEDYADTITAERVKRVIDGYKKDKEIVLYDEEITVANISNGKEMLEEAKRIKKEAKGKYSKVKNPAIKDGHLRVIAKMEAKGDVPGLGGGFTFYELGDTLLNGEYLNESVGIDKIREYIYYTETKQVVESKEDEPHYLGSYIDTAYYFYYDKENVTTLDRDFLHTIKTKSAHYVIYADKCILSDTELEKYNITFKKIPRDITRL